MTLHIGKILSQLFESRRIRKAALARMMHVHPVQINHYLKNESIQTSRLYINIYKIVQFLLD